MRLRVVAYDVDMAYPIIPALGSQRGEKKCTGNHTRGSLTGLNHDSKGSTIDFFAPQKCFWTSSRLITV
jgi:hypothetical protein